VSPEGLNVIERHETPPHSHCDPWVVWLGVFKAVIFLVVVLVILDA
jgi:hypothetical protein